MTAAARPVPADAAAADEALAATLARWRRDALFVVWGPPGHGPRSSAFAGVLGIDAEFVYSTTRRGLGAAPFKYPYQALVTSMLLRHRRPSLVFVQSPPSLAVALVAAYARSAGGRYVIDAHSDAFLSPVWARPHWLQRTLIRRAAATIVTSQHFADLVRGLGGRAVVLRDVPASPPAGRPPPGMVPRTAEDAFAVTFVCTFAADEPLCEVLAAARTLPGVRVYVTGDPRRARPAVLRGAPSNVRFTGYLPDAEYYGLLAASDAVMCLTTRDHTMQRGACEALALGRPVITSGWPLLRSYFRQGAVHVDNTAAGIAAGVREMRAGHDRHARGIQALRHGRQREWEAGLCSLTGLLSEAEATGKGGGQHDDEDRGLRARLRRGGHRGGAG